MSKPMFFIILLLTIIITACRDGKRADNIETLKFSVAEQIPVPEPSGLVLSWDEKYFWVVSDENSRVYLLDSWGKVVKSFKVDGEDLEGITVIDEKTIAVVLERTREVVILDTSGVELKRTKLNLEGELNMGLEGITYDREGKRFYVLNEKKPRLLITLDENLEELSRDTLNFSKDVSGIHYDPVDDILWILSDESQSIYKTDLSGNPFQEFKIKVAQPEGITLNKARTRLYVVCDKTEKLYVFNLE
jgi:uncharacterized protein YjiK